MLIQLRDGVHAASRPATVTGGIRARTGPAGVCTSRYHPGCRQLGARPAAHRQGRRRTNRADARRQRHVKVIEIQCVTGHGPGRAFRQAFRQPCYAMTASSDRHRHHVKQRSICQLQIARPRLSSAAHRARIWATDVIGPHPGPRWLRRVPSRRA